MVDVEYVGKCLLVNGEVLVVGDLHFGFGEAARESGFLMPGDLYNDIIKEFDDVFEKTGNVNKIVLLGDVKHVFGTILAEEWNHIQRFFDYLKDKCNEIIVVKGNHDKIIEPILKDRKINALDYFIDNGICYLHGDKDVVDAYGCSSWIVGHGHPAIVIGDKVRKEKYKCFLTGEFEGKEVIVVPSFFPLIEGTNVSEMKNGKELKLAWDFDLSEFEVKVVDGLEIRDFGKLNDIKN